MERIPNAVYTKEFREEAVKLVTEQGLSMPDGSRRLSIPKSTITYWVQEERKGKSVGSSKKTLSEAETELAKVKRELAQVKMKRDFLRKAAAYFAKEPQSGTRSIKTSSTERLSDMLWDRESPRTSLSNLF